MPQNNFPKTYEPAKHEDEIYRRWEESGYFNPDNLPVSKEAKNYAIVMPPPNVTGVLHMGHAAMLALEDILIRYHRLLGERTLWLPGTDHAAIATQTKVEKLLKAEGLSRHQLGRVEFLARVRAFARQSHDTIANQIKKMGSSCDWSREAYTLDETRTRAVRSVFKMMFDDGLIYRGERIVNWCPRCHSTLADDEVEYKQQTAKLYTFRYDKDFPIAIATTRPETKLGDTAVAVNPADGRYQKYIGQTFSVNFLGQPLTIKIIADRSVEMDFGTGALGVTPAHSIVDWQLAEKHNLPVVKVIDENGKIRAGFGPFSGQPARQAGELIVKKLRAAGLLLKEEEIENNLSLCYRCETPIEPLPSKQWFIAVNKPVKKFGGRTIKEVAIEAVKTGFGGDRAKKINIYPRRFEKNYFHWLENLRDWCISRQIWFGHQIPVWYWKNSKGKGQRAKLMELNFRDIKIFNLIKEGKKTIETRALNPDEPNRYFGDIKEGDWIVFNYKQGDRTVDSLKIKAGRVMIYKTVDNLLANEAIESILPGQNKAALIKFWQSIPGYWQKIKQHGLVAIEIKEVKSFSEIYVGIEPPAGEGWEQDPDTLDTWFSSGLWTFSTLARRPEQIKIAGDWLAIDSPDFKKFHPTAVLETGYDILFFWVARMIITTTYAVGDIPFRDVYLHGLVLDEQGQKMSKSKGNVIDPLEMIKKYGTDATRLSLVVGSTPGNDLRLSEEKVASWRNFANKLWNIYRFASQRAGKNFSLTAAPQINSRDLTVADKWILAKMRQLIKAVTADLDNYRFSSAAEKLRQFSWGDLADWYLEISKFEKSGPKEKIFGLILPDLLKLWHPFMPFVTEAIFTASLSQTNADTASPSQTDADGAQTDADTAAPDRLLMVAGWPEDERYEKILGSDKGDEFEIVKDIIVAIRAARAEHKVEPGRKIKAVVYAGQHSDLVKDNAGLIKSLRTGLSELDVKSQGEKIKDALFAATGAAEIYLLGAVDKEKEKARLAKEIARLERALAGVEKKLNNQEFLKKAPPAVVAREQDKQKAWQKELEKLKKRLKTLSI